MNGKDYSISVIRISAMMMIVFYHCICYNAGVWAFSPPSEYNPLLLSIIHNLSYIGLFAFTFISGFLYHKIVTTTARYNDETAFVKRKACRLLLPYLFWTGVLCLLFPYSYGLSSFYLASSHLWFLLMLFDVFLIVSLIQNVWKNANIYKNLIILVSMIALEIGVDVIVARFHFNPLLGIREAIDYLPIFFLGMLFDEYKVIIPNIIGNRKLSRIPSILILAGLYLLGSLLNYIHLPAYWIWPMIPALAFVIIAYYQIKVYIDLDKFAGGGCRKFIRQI